jgi:flagellar hook-basal body complex protein FliE
MSVNSIENIGLISSASEASSKNKLKDNAKIPFSDFLSQAMQSTNQLILESEKLNDEFAAGITDNIHEVLIAAEKADIALQFTIQLRNKIMDAYNEIMRMQI